MRAVRKGLLALALVAGIVTVAQADSIWARRSPRFGFLFNDNRARNVGDVLTLILSETTAIGQREQRQTSRASTIAEQFGFEGASSSDSVSRAGAASLDLSSASNLTFNGASQLQSNRVLTDRMGVTVIDVLPNGNLVVEGHRIRKIAGEKRVLRITGIVRPADLSPANTIFSEVVANFKIEYVGRGQDSEVVNQGWFSRWFNLMWKF